MCIRDRFIAIGVRNWWLKVNNFDYDATLPELCHQYLEKGKDMAPQAMENLTTLANSVVLDKTHVTDTVSYTHLGVKTEHCIIGILAA